MMKRQMLLVVAAISLIPAVISHSNGEAPAPAGDDAKTTEYAKVELKGQLSESMTKEAIVHVSDGYGGHEFPLDLSTGPKEFRGDGWHKLEGKTVIVTGILHFPPRPQGRMVVEVTSIRIVDK